jgi:pilus assembly protein Flp/PilA
MTIMSAERESLCDCPLPSFPKGFEVPAQAESIASPRRGKGFIGDNEMGNRVLEIGERIRELGERLRDREDGQGMVEYALILVLISIVVIVILSTLGKTVNNVFSNVSHGLAN